ncbi:RNA polymerase sigma factor [Sphingomonas sp. CL5.1]|uniref:RNA polymerase sigma factor n=1 Tax=Sphingomonas sp. CL5.1 TaxID=2653203 RepID=UPI001581D9A0|nr:RNA polymerase sigma factor [Sphingomonas sp. CL5.1]QKR98294.1 RNA polymerase sigma factor [Sphingomonas sp. CL5.1]
MATTIVHIAMQRMIEADARVLSTMRETAMLERSIDIGGDAEQPSDPKAEITALYQAELPRITRYLRRKLGHPEEAADVAHDAFFRLVRIRPDRKIETPQAYLRLIVANLLKDRAAKVATRIQGSIDPLDEESLPASMIDPHRELVGRQELDHVHHALRKLKPVTRQVFLLSRVEGLTYREIQERLSLSEGVVKAHMRKALHLISRVRSTL